jgi:hypothetical protein
MSFTTQSEYGPIVLQAQRAGDGPLTVSVPAASVFWRSGLTYTINPSPVPGILVNGVPLSQYPVSQQRLHLAGLTGAVPNRN